MVFFIRLPNAKLPDENLPMTWSVYFDFTTNLEYTTQLRMTLRCQDV